MTLKFSFFFAALGVLISCNHQEKQAADKPQANLLKCYRYINKNDTVILKTNSVNDSVTGTLTYNFYEKDKNTGTIRGRMKDDIIIADYTFASEGTESVREVAFKKNGETYVEGYGETEDKNGKTSFKNTDSLIFTPSVLLSAYDCEK